MKKKAQLESASTVLGGPPSLIRRLLCMSYEAMLLFGLIFMSALLFGVLMQQRHALLYRHILQVCLFLIIGIYFVGFWYRGGQTLAMKTWHIRLTDPYGKGVSLRRAALRYFLCWLWFLPPAILIWFFGIHHGLSITILVAWFTVWFCTMYTHPDRQFLHDRLSGTKLIMSSTRYAAK